MGTNYHVMIRRPYEAHAKRIWTADDLMILDVTGLIAQPIN